jgi:hypothetical protein
MNLQTLVRNDADVHALAGADQTGLGLALLNAIRVESARLAKIEPLLNCERMRDDYRHVLGEKLGVRFALRLINAARLELNMQPLPE